MPRSIRYFSCLIFSAISIGVCSQNSSQIDSLKQELKNSSKKAQILNSLAKEYLSVSTEEADNYAEEAMYHAMKEKDTAEMGTALWIKARVQTQTNNYIRSNQLADSSLLMLEKTKNYSLMVNCNVLKASNNMLQGKYESALELYEKCALQATDIDAKDILASILINMGRIYRVRGNHKEATENFENALKIAEELDDSYLKAMSYHFIGLTYDDQQYFDLAIEHYLKALSIMKELNLQIQIAYLLIDLGSSCRAAKNYTDALKYLNTSAKRFANSNDRWGLYELNRNLGLTYFEMNNLDSAWYCFQTSLKYSQEINEKAGESNSMNYLGEILVHQEKYEEALIYLNKALLLNEEVKNDLMLTNILFNIGKCYVYMGRPKKGLSILKRSLRKADSLNIRYERMVINKEISTAYTQLENYKLALKHFEIFTRIGDSIYTDESNRHFAEMERKYQSELQKQEISQLRLDNIEQEITIRKQRSVRNIFLLGFIFASITGFLFYKSYLMKKRADQEKDSLLKEIHHRVKNNLQIISSLLSIQTDSVTDSKVISAVQESQSRVKAMALIHQLLYQDQDLSRIDFGIYLPQLVNAISSIFQKEGYKIKTEIEAKDILFDIDTAVPLGLIVAELIANAYKYAFEGRKEGTIHVSVVNKTKNHYLLSIADNGVGLPKSINFTELSSMGLRLVNILTSQLDGKLSYEYRNGAVFTIEFSHVL